MVFPLYLISGLSGSGKTTLGQKVASDLGYYFIDIDKYYISNKPQVTLSTGQTVSNWDCHAALDLSRFRQDVLKLIQHKPTIVAGFALDRTSLSYLHPKIHFHLLLSRKEDEIFERCLAARQQSKPKIDAQLDWQMVKDVVLPFYWQIRSQSSIDYMIETYDANGQRKSVELLALTIEELIKMK